MNLRLGSLACIAALVALGGCIGSGGIPAAARDGVPAPLVPDPRLTPGDVLAVTAKDVCVRGYSGKVRNVPQAVKNAVYHAYNIDPHKSPGGPWEVDHDVSLELGGSNSAKNLWPESYVTHPWNAHVKDRLENQLHAEVCGGKITLSQAQTEIRGDWRVAYAKRFGQPK